MSPGVAVIISLAILLSTAVSITVLAAMVRSGQISKEMEDERQRRIVNEHNQVDDA